MRICRRTLVSLVVIAVWATPTCADSGRWRWERSPSFEEVSFTATIDPSVRIHVNAPLDAAGKPARATRLIVYALPNGNTIEQTLGCEMTKGLDWHFDIQHVAAQVRMLRTLLPEDRVVLICAEAPGLSWPSFRKTTPRPNEQIRAMVDGWRTEFGSDQTMVTLTGHSGGGAFMFGVIEGGDEVPAYIDRIAFLDANYSFDAALHAAKLQRWLDGDDRRQLIVLAYDDREITFQGKKVVGPDGGTFRATGRMRDALAEACKLRDQERLPFREAVGLDGRVHFYVHTNPDNKILHTALVGEMNGLLHIATLGTPQEEKWGRFGEPRAYVRWIQPPPNAKTAEAASSQETSEPADKPVAGSQATFPPRPVDAIGGAEFMKQIDSLGLGAREAAIEREIVRGNFPEFLRRFQTVKVHGDIGQGEKRRTVESAIEVMPDYLAVGSDEDFARVPMTPQTAQRVAERFHCTLPTRKLVDAIDAQATVRLAPHPLTEKREAAATFWQHHQIIEGQRDGRPVGELITGIKKDIVLTPRIFEKPQRLAIYGWRQSNGQPIQPLTIVHWNRYVDYSHGARLVRNEIEIDGKPRRIDDVLADPDSCGLVSDEGPMTPPRYPSE